MKETPSEAEFLAIFRQIDEPVQVAFAEAIQWFSQLPRDQPHPTMSEMDTLIRSIVARNVAKENGSIN